MKPSAKWVAFSIALAFLTALCASRSTGRLDSPEGWHRVTRGQPFVSQAVLASGPPKLNAWSIAAYEGLVSDTRHSSIAIDATLPESGVLTLSLHHEASDATALVIATGSEPYGARVTPDGVTQRISCSGNMPATTIGPASFELKQTNNGWTATSGQHSIDCTGPAQAGTPSITAGLRRVPIHSISTGTTHASVPLAPTIIMAFVAGLGLLAGLMWAARSSPRTAMAIGIASLSGWSIAHLDGARVAEILRLIDLNGNWLPVTASATLALFTGTIGLAIRWAKHRPMPWSFGVTVGLFVAIAAIWPVIGAMGWAYTLLGGVSLGGLIWVNVHAGRIRHYNWIALALSGVLLGAAEVMVRYSHVGSLWNAADAHHGTGSMNTLFQQFEGLKAGVHSVYPSGGFPVKAAPKTQPNRIACLGASSTGGAFQNDSLDDFYPARLAQSGPAGTEIINQGVGGWTSLHVLKFLEGHANAIDSDVWTIYLGVNEHMPTRMPYADLYDLWESGSGQANLSALDNIRLFQALRLLVRGLGSSAGAGVPPSHFEDNLEAIAALAKTHNANVLMMNEGIQPDPNALWQYTDVMESLAQKHEHVQFLDTAAALDSVGSAAFMDSNHLTDLGHRTVSAAMSQELTRLNWW